MRTLLEECGVSVLPSVLTIERVISQAGLTKPKQKTEKVEITYPTLKPDQPHQLIQVDIVPHFLRGGQRVSCFDALDVVSRYPTGQAFLQKRSQDAAQFLIQVWQNIGLPQYTQVDNEGCFSGGATHPYVLGKVVRLALLVGTELVFSPTYHPKSNGFVERFHQDYNQHVWQDTYLQNMRAVNQRADHFFQLYRQRKGHRRLGKQTPAECHQQQPLRKLETDFALPNKLPLCEGRVHFMRRIRADGTIRVLNVDWIVPGRKPDSGVWVTLELTSSGATLSVFDAAPDRVERNCLISHPFPLKEPVLPREESVSAQPDDNQIIVYPGVQIQRVSGEPKKPKVQVKKGGRKQFGSVRIWQQIPYSRKAVKSGEKVLSATLRQTAHLRHRWPFTML